MVFKDEGPPLSGSGPTNVLPALGEPHSSGTSENAFASASQESGTRAE